MTDRDVAAEMEDSRQREARLEAALGKGLIVSLADFLSEPSDGRPMIVGQGVVPRESIVLLAGDSGTGKTSLAVQTALSIAAGSRLFDFEVGRCPVLFLEAEGNRDEFRKRIATCIQSLGLSGNELPVYFHRLGTTLSLESEEGDELLLMIRAAEAGFVVLDTVGLFHDGEENSASEWKRSVVKPLRRLIGRTGTAFLLLHHFGKPVEGKTSRHLIRGTSAMVGDVETVLLLEQAKTNGWDRILTFEKIRHGPHREPVVLRFDQGGAVFERTDLDPILAKRPRLAEVQRVILADGELKTSVLVAAICERLNVRRSQAENLIAEAHAAGLISRPRRGIYSAPGGLLLQKPTDGAGLFFPDSPDPLTGIGEFGEVMKESPTSPEGPNRGSRGSRENGSCSYFCGETIAAPCTRCGRSFSFHQTEPGS